MTPFVRKHGWLIVAIAASSVTGVTLYSFALGWAYSLDRWDISQFVWRLLLALFASIAGAVAGALYERENRADAVAATFAWLTRVVLASTLALFLFCNAGWARGLFHFVGRQLTFVGSARDLPPPPPSR